MAISATKLKRFIERPDAMKKDPDYPIFQVGVEQGQGDERNRILTFLEKEYINGDFERGSVEAEAILTLAGRLGRFIRGEDE